MSFVSFITKYFILVDAIISGIIFLNVLLRLLIVNVHKCNWFLCVDFGSYNFAEFAF